MEYDIFARTSPEHKLRLVKALQDNGEVVGMTGDGVNDALTLRQADVGIAMGIKGTEVTKEAADMVLTDDNFATIASSVKEGRRVYDNLKKTILFIMPTNLAQGLLIIIALLAGNIIPLTPVLILWMNMATSATLSFGLAFEAAERNVMNRPPRKTYQHVMDGFAVWRVAFVGSMIAIAAFILEAWLAPRGHSPEFIRTVLLQMLVTAQWVYMINCRSSDSFSLSMGLLRNKGIWLVTRRPAADAAGHYLCPADAKHVWYGSAAAALLVCHSGHRRRHVPGGGNREASDALGSAKRPEQSRAPRCRRALLSQGSSMIKTFRFALLACGLVGGALTATAAPAWCLVRVATVELAPHAEERAIPGRVEAIRAVDIRARTEGVIVQRHFQDGQYVTEGDLLFTLDDAQPRAALALAQAELKSAEASLRQSQQLLTRYERLINNHSISRNDVDTARMQRDVAAAAVQQAKARVEAQRIVLSYTQITAPR